MFIISNDCCFKYEWCPNTAIMNNIMNALSTSVCEHKGRIIEPKSYQRIRNLLSKGNERERISFRKNRSQVKWIVHKSTRSTCSCVPNSNQKYLGDLYAESGQTLQGSFSAVSTPIFASKYSLESSRRDLHNALLCTAL